ncbi:YozE family protein [Chryseomicrobium aureum]|uniref:YozE family protein n=1 Tax=Chryseomicrobium aureum TaxID=1441723 RepID=UPI00195B8167|nr:YozE family protein [Chryseomicrobium aureum]MBM7705613.1 uncharacterized protein YozE (UPF0346 family) [Chryseomicrobium aureum]
MRDTFYQFVLRHRGGSASNPKHRFAERVFELHDFPKNTNDFYELSTYIEMQADDAIPASIFDELWEEYKTK